MAETGAEEGAVAGSGVGGSAPARPEPAGSAPAGPATRAVGVAGRRSRGRAWAELLRVSALFTVPGDVLAGAAASGARPTARTLFAIGSSLCLYASGMALNDWADRHEDAAERPHRPLPSGRVRPAAALAAACALTGGGLGLAAVAGRPALAVAAPLAATVWAYDLALKRTPAGPAAMAAARGLDLLLGAAATTGRTREALPSAGLLGAHTLAVTAVSRQETRGGTSLAPLAALTVTGLLTRLVTHHPARSPADRREAAAPDLPGPRGPRGLTREATHHATSRDLPDRLRGAPHPAIGHLRPPAHPTARPASDALRILLGAAYAGAAARPYAHAVLNPSPPLTQRAVAGGIRATIPLQAALAARSGAPVTALLVAVLAPLGRSSARRVSVT
ncbi:SCO3242 family prenyltransferase [Streptomyces sp. NPDC087903]|uniref:SCO3242 family prenyltransferase n=1 Tax=Streptomyces sp. NPDC087903 TaxID=3365819 RepID=UPI003823FE04